MSALFAYTGRTTDGRFVAGSLEAESLASAIAQLRARPVFLTSIAPNDSPSGIAGRLVSAWPVAPRARVAFFRSFATLVRAGVPIRRALEVTVASCRDARLREAVAAIAAEIESGSELSSAMARRPREFPQLFVAMVRAGEVGGALDAVLERLAELVERHHALRKRVQSALTYPAIVTCAALCLVLFIVVSCVPGFGAMFAQMRVPLPPATQALIATAALLQRPWVWAALASAPVAALAAWRLAQRHERVAALCSRAAFALPLAGALMRRAILARIARTLGTLLASGVPVLLALAAAEDVADDALYRACMADVGVALAEGNAMASALERSGLFEALAIQLVRVGEESGALDAMLLRVAEYYELDVETSLAALSSVIEPALILFLGAVVGLIVASVLLPLYSMIGSIT